MKTVAVSGPARAARVGGGFGLSDRICVGTLNCRKLAKQIQNTRQRFVVSLAVCKRSE